MWPRFLLRRAAASPRRGRSCRGWGAADVSRAWVGGSPWAGPPWKGKVAAVARVSDRDGASEAETHGEKRSGRVRSARRGAYEVCVRVWSGLRGARKGETQKYCN